MKKPKTKKQKDFLKNLASGDTPHAAAVKAGYKSPSSAARETIDNHREYIEKTLKEKGPTFELVVERLKACMTATKVVGYLNNKVQGTEKVSDEFVEIPDFQVQVKAIDIACKLYSAYPPTKVAMGNDDGKPFEVKIKYA